MSVAAMTWAFALELRPSALKFLLVAMADAADSDGILYPSIGALISKTSQDRKTVIAGIERLEKIGFLTDTGKRVGKTKQVKVYRLTGFTNSPKNGTVINGSKNGTVPFFPPNSTVFPAEQSRFSQQTVPKTVHGSVMDPSMEPSGNRQSSRAKRAPTATRLPADFALSPERRTVAVAESLDPERTFAKFCDYWRAASGAKARKHDWDATWRNWCRTEADRSRGSIPRRPFTPAPSTAELEAREARRLGITVEELRRREACDAC